MTAFLLKLWAFVRPYRARFFLGLVCGILYGLANGLLVAVTSPVVDMVFHGSTHFHDKLTTYAKLHPKLRLLLEQIAARLPEISGPSSLWGWLLVFSIIPCVMLLRVVLAYLSIYLTNWAAARAIADIRTKLFDHMQNLSLSFFSRAKTGDLIARITNDTQILYGIIGNSFASMIKDPVTVVLILAVQLLLHPKLLLVSFVVMPVCIVPIIIYGRKVRKSARAMQGHI